MIATGTLPAPGAGDPLAPVTNKHTDERWYPYPADLSDLFESITYLIGAGVSKPWLAKWHGKVAMTWAVDHLELLAKTLAAEGKNAAVALGKDEAERLRQVKSDIGTHLHDIGEALILWATEPDGTRHHVPFPELPERLRDAVYDYEPDGTPISATEIIAQMADGLVQFVSDHGLSREDFLACEMQVYNPDLRIAGTLDAIIVLRDLNICGQGGHCHLGAFCTGEGTHTVADPGHLLVLCVDFKTGRTLDGTVKEQLAAYRRCPECLPDKTDDRLRATPQTQAGAILHLRPEHPGGYLLELVSAGDEEEAWETFLDAVAVLRNRAARKDKPGTSIRPLRADGTMPGWRLGDLAAEGYGRALAPLRKALGADCELDDLTRFTADEVLAIKGVGPALIETTRHMLAAHGLSLAGETPEITKAA